MPDKKLTDVETIKGLRYIGASSLCRNCAFSPKCKSQCIFVAALDLINRQKAEIERMKANLNVELENFASEYDNKIKAEAIKEFAEKLKRKRPVSISGCTGWVDFDAIDNLVKEMTE